MTKLLAPLDAASVLGVREQTLAVWRSTGRYGLPFVRVGRRIKYREQDIENWLKRRTATSTGQADTTAGEGRP